MSVDLYNGIVRPDGSKLEFVIPLTGVKVIDLKTVNHPAFQAKGSKGLVAIEAFSPGDYIGSYGGKICYFQETNEGETDIAMWNPYQLTPDPDGNYYIDGMEVGNELRFCNDPQGTGRAPNAQFYQSDERVGGFYVCDVYAVVGHKTRRRNFGVIRGRLLGVAPRLV